MLEYFFSERGNIGLIGLGVQNFGYDFIGFGADV